jgi:prophage DNA circulation protein
MADWRDNFRQGKFRGIEFFTNSHEFSSGRRKQDHEFPQRDEGKSEDLGKRTPGFSLDMYVLGDDYFTKRDELLAALEQEGPGELIHPYLGRKVVQVGNFSLRESVGEGRIARFSVEFVEAGAVLFPESLEDALETGIENADDLIDKSKDAFETAFDVANQPAFIIQAAADAAAAIGTFMEKSVAKFTAPISNLTYAISNFKADVGNLIRTPGELAERIDELFNDLLTEFEDDPDTGENVLGNFNLFADEFEVIVATTPSRERQLQNQNAIIGISNHISVANHSKAAFEIDYTSTNQAVEIRDNIAGLLDDQLNDIIDDDLYQSAKDLQASVVKALPPSGITDLITFTPKNDMPAIVIAYDLFEDLEKETEIIDQNNIMHPGFVPGGEEIEVASG